MARATRVEFTEPFGELSASSPDSVVDLLLLRARAAPEAAEHIESDVLILFDRYAPQLMHYASSFGLGTGEAEDVVQDTFLALFRHLHLGRNQSNLAGWLFQVTHNLALKQRSRRRRQQDRDTWDDALVGQQADPLYTANGPSNDVSVIDLATRQVTKKIPVGTRPWGVTVVKRSVAAR